MTNTGYNQGNSWKVHFSPKNTQSQQQFVKPFWPLKWIFHKASQKRRLWSIPLPRCCRVLWRPSPQLKFWGLKAPRGALASLNLHTWLTLRNTGGGIQLLAVAPQLQYGSLAVRARPLPCPKKELAAARRFTVNNEVVRSCLLFLLRTWSLYLRRCSWRYLVFPLYLNQAVRFKIFFTSEEHV